jgi:hypothetical protein
MLYDKRWDKKLKKPRVYTLKNLIAWLEHQPAHLQYNFGDAENCLLGQFAHAMGARDPAKTSNALSLRDPFWHIANPPRTAWSTFGAARERARALIRK